MFTTKLGLNRGKARVWLERGVLRAAGLAHGVAYDVTPSGNTLIITANPQGARHVAGTPERPIIDINGARILAGLGSPGAALHVTNPAPGEQIVTPPSTR